jgi:hypothetical protein
MALRSALSEKYGTNTSLYFPWNPYRGGPMRTFQAYLTKLPRDTVKFIPGLVDLLELVEGAYARRLAPTAETDLLSGSIEELAGRGAPRRGQGFHLDQQVKVAVEAHAMNAAILFFKNYGEVLDVRGHESFDLVCYRGLVETHVEVKGTTTTGTEIILTPNEVNHARTYPHVTLFILADIEVTRDAVGNISASGGRPVLLDPWCIDPESLTPLGYQYRLV